MWMKKTPLAQTHVRDVKPQHVEDQERRMAGSQNGGHLLFIGGMSCEKEHTPLAQVPFLCQVTALNTPLVACA